MRHLPALVSPIQGFAMPANPPRVVTTQEVFAAMAATGMFNFTSGDQVRRVVIDLAAKAMPVIHVECWGDERLLEVVPVLGRIEVRTGIRLGPDESGTGPATPAEREAGQDTARLLQEHDDR